MATKKTAAAAAPESETALTVKAAGGEVVTYDYGDNAGKGWEDADQSDFQIPFLNQLQGLSSEVDEGEDVYVEGAKPGHFLNSVTRQLFTEEVHLVPILRQRRFVEWTPRDSGGGLVAVHMPDDPIVGEAISAAAGSLKLKTPEGNDLIETYYVYCVLLESPENLDASSIVVLPFTKTKIKRYKGFMTTLRTAFKGVDKVPMFAHRLTMKATREKNSSGQTYFNVQLSPSLGDVQASMIPSSEAEFLTACRGISDMVEKGSAKIDYSTADNENTTGGEADSGDKPY